MGKESKAGVTRRLRPQPNIPVSTRHVTLAQHARRNHRPRPACGPGQHLKIRKQNYTVAARGAASAPPPASAGHLSARATQLRQRPPEEERVSPSLRPLGKLATAPRGDRPSAMEKRRLKKTSPQLLVSSGPRSSSRRLRTAWCAASATSTDKTIRLPISRRRLMHHAASHDE